ncbi:uncharacterized protein [Solanum lycopersicum]|uniref:uncharacterized protein n=1 Tax=Solanum lycopersicum TaxID=4081 RepID=UPI0037485457
MADFLADHPIPNDRELTDELPNEDGMLIEVQSPWKMYFDGAGHRGRAGAGVVFITSQEEILPFSFTLKQCCSNNVDEYQALIIGLEMDVDMNQLHLQVFGWTGDVTLQHVCRIENKRADALAALASMLTLPDQTQEIVCKKWTVPPPNEEEYIENDLDYIVSVAEAVKEYWRQSIVDYMCYGILPENPRRRTDIRHRPPPKSSGGHLHILAATNYFSKWADVVALKEVNKENVVNFIQVNIIYRFGIPRYIITDNGKPFDNKLMNKIYDFFGFKQLLPLEHQISSLKLAIQEGLTEEENARLRLAELEALDEKSLEAQQNLECYQARLSRAFNKKVRLRCFEVGDQVLIVIRPIITSHNLVANLPQSEMDHMSYKKHIQMVLTSLLMLMA